MGAMPRVTAILVVQDGDRWLDRTLAALASQTRRPDALVVVAEPSAASTAAFAAARASCERLAVLCGADIEDCAGRRTHAVAENPLNRILCQE